MAKGFARALIVGFLISGAPASAETSDAENFDLACAVTGSAEIAKDSSEETKRIYRPMINFYLGRLSIRNEKLPWSAMVDELVRDRLDKPALTDFLKECMDLYTRKTQ